MNQKENSPEFIALLDFLKRNRGFDFSGYKPPSLIRRIEKRMQMVNIKTYPEYIEYLEVHPDEFSELFNTILINVTGFFRDPAAWDYLSKEILPAIVQNKDSHEIIRIWSTGCASGEESYSIAMLMAEMLGMEGYLNRVKIYATDVDEDALSKARQPDYSEKEIEGIPPELLEKYFLRNGSNFVINKDLRRNMIFGRNDLIQDAPISKIDLLICRNTLMYFNAEAQSKILNRFHFALRDDGILFLGRAEMLLTHTNMFTPVDLKLRIFRKVPRIGLRERTVMMNRNNVPEENTNQFNDLAYIRDSVFDTTPLPQLVLDANINLILANEKARSTFKLSDRDLNRPFQDLQLSYYPVELRSSIRRVYVEQAPLILKDVEWPLSSNEKIIFDIRISPLKVTGGLITGISLSFIDISLHKKLQYQLEQTNHELETAYEELQSTNEGLETTNEELQSTGEELETTNEELQSTNEELETTNEELQVTNEELQNINDELRLRIEDLNRLNAFNASILSSIHGGAIMIDNDMNVQVWNRRSEDLWGLRSDEVVGKNFFNLDIGLPVDKLKKIVIACLSGESSTEEIVLEGRNRRGQQLQYKITATPIRNNHKRIEGVITLVEGVDSRM